MGLPGTVTQENLFTWGGREYQGSDHGGFARREDPSTSHEAAAIVEREQGTTAVVRRGSQKHRLLLDAAIYPAPAIDRERALRADLPARSCWWHRVTDLRDGGYLLVVDEDGFDPETGKRCRRTTITALGRAMLEALR